MILAFNQTLSIILLCICVVPIAILIIWALIQTIRKSIKNNKKVISGSNEEQKQIFCNAYGGLDNILGINIERNKISVKVKDCDLVDGERLKELGASGVLIVGDEIRASFGDRARLVYETLNN